MWAVAFALTYTGLAALALSMNRHAHDALQRELLNEQRLALRVAGWALLSVSLALTATRTGWPVGTLEWLGTVTVGGLLLVLVLTYVPRVAVALALALPAIAAIAALLA